MKPGYLVPLAAAALLLTTGCDKSPRESAQRVAELERQAADAVAKQRELEQQLAEQQLAAERDAIERERMRIEEDRLEMERRQSKDAAAEAERIRQREAELASREGKLLRIESELENKEETLDQRGAELNERDRELAGREALAGAGERDEEPSAPANDFGLFYDSLSPYGSWFETADYGYVWQPVVVRDTTWRPYTRGRWACTDRGWTWISDEPFGWACYHYGRWALCRGYGWVWVPGTEWAPSWVCWRSSGSHIGWAPLPPETLAWRGHRWDSSVEISFGIGSAWFNFVEIGNFGHPIHHHCLPYTNNDVYIQQTVNITNIHIHNRRVICGGPRYSDVAIQTKHRPPFYRIEENRHAQFGRDSAALRPRVSGDRLLVTSPNVDSAWNDAVRPAKVKNRVDQFQIDRKEPLRPEITERFRQTREESRRKAGETIAKLGGEDAFRKARAEQIRQPRVETPRQPATTVTGQSAAIRQPATAGGPRPVAPRDDMPPAGSDPRTTERLRDSGMRPAQPPQRPATEITRNPPRTETSRIEEQRREPATTNRPPRPVAPRDGMPPAGSDAKTIERLRDSGMRPATPRPPAEDPAERIRRNQQQEEQAERARRNLQQELERQREQARQAQAEQARREQQRQQQIEQQQRARQLREQMERVREQQERARQQREQMERARQQQEQTRQQEERRGGNR